MPFKVRPEVSRIALHYWLMLSSGVSNPDAYNFLMARIYFLCTYASLIILKNKYVQQCNFNRENTFSWSILYANYTYSVLLAAVYVR